MFCPPAALAAASVRTTDVAEAATWVRGVERTGPRELRIQGENPLATAADVMVRAPMRLMLRGSVTEPRAAATGLGIRY